MQTLPIYMVWKEMEHGSRLRCRYYDRMLNVPFCFAHSGRVVPEFGNQVQDHPNYNRFKGIRIRTASQVL
jgi:hypothetical protein